MDEKYCPTCYLEEHEIVGIMHRSKLNEENGQEIIKYHCVKRGHMIKGSGLTLPQLKLLKRLHTVENH